VGSCCENRRVNFFDWPPPQEPHEDEGVPVRRREWLAPPANVLPAAVPLRLVLARPDSTVVAITDASAYTNGFQLTLTVQRRSPGAGHEEAAADSSYTDPFGTFLVRGPKESRPHELPSLVLRFGMEFSDGRKVTTLDPWPSAEGTAPPAVLRQGGGGGSQRHYESKFWVWPLPSPGQMTFAVEWPSEHIKLTTTQIDADLVLNASKHAEPLWPEQAREDINPGSGRFRIVIEPTSQSSPLEPFDEDDDRDEGDGKRPA
jgi:hypothetical protein